MNKHNDEPSGQPHKKHHSSRKKQWILGVIAAVVLFLGSAVVASFLANQKQKLDLQADTPASKIDQITYSAQKLASNGKSEDAVRLYDDAIDGASDSAVKRKLLISKATLYFNAEFYDEALNAALQAENIETATASVELLAQIYEKKNDIAKAIEYYKQALALIDKSTPMAADDTEYYNYRIKLLNGTLE